MTEFFANLSGARLKYVLDNVNIFQIGPFTYGNIIGKIQESR